MCSQLLLEHRVHLSLLSSRSEIRAAETISQVVNLADQGQETDRGKLWRCLSLRQLDQKRSNVVSVAEG